MMLFRVRFETDDRFEREVFINSLKFGWLPVRVHVAGTRRIRSWYAQVNDEEKEKLKVELLAASPFLGEKFAEEKFYKVSRFGSFRLCRN
jgi:hypothetical protein